MPTPQRIKTTQEFQTFIAANPQLTTLPLLEMRIACYQAIEALRKRPLFIYAQNL